MTQDQQDAYAERAAIMEYDGNMPRETAVRLAHIDVYGTENKNTLDSLTDKEYTGGTV